MSDFKERVDRLRNGLEDDYWYGEEDEKTFEELVRKAEILNEIEEIMGDETTSRIGKYFKAVTVLNKYYEGRDLE